MIPNLTRGAARAFCAIPWPCPDPSIVGEERRRVLQVDYAAGELPSGLEWLGV
jgi:hypothetical protein